MNGRNLSRRSLLLSLAAPLLCHGSPSQPVGIEPGELHRGETWGAWAKLLALWEHVSLRDRFPGKAERMNYVVLIEFMPTVFVWVGVGPVQAAARDHADYRAILNGCARIAILGHAMTDDRCAWCVMAKSDLSKAELRHVRDSVKRGDL